MDDSCVRRGEIWLVDFDGCRVPAVVVSSNEYNARSHFVVVASISESSKRVTRGYYVQVKTENTRGLLGVDRTVRLTKGCLVQCLGQVPPKIMGLVDDILESLFDLGYEDADKDQEIARLKREVENGRDSALSSSAEAARYKALYEQAVKQMAEMQVNVDVAKIVTEKQEPDDVIEETPEEPQQKKPSKKVNVNTATVRELMQVGFGKSEAARIVYWGQSCGGFDSLDDLTAVDGVTAKKVRKLRDKLEI